MANNEVRLPPGCGEDLGKVLLYSPYQQLFQSARRQRYCLNCQTLGEMDATSVFVCTKCHTRHTSNLTAPRIFDRLLVLSGRGGGKTLIGAHAAREEMMVPNSIGWVMGPTYKVLHDSTFPTLIRLIPPEWVARWDPEHMEVRLTNGAMVAFRSLEDPERARGPHGVGWGWFDEAAQCPERAYDVFEPTLIAAGGIVICTTTVMGYDWTYDKIEKRALVYKEPGYWTCRFWTEENPLFRSSPVMMKQIERAKTSMAPAFYAQEYKAERRNATGLVYDFELVEKQTLLNAAEVKKFIPEWPNIDPSRPCIVGLDSGADHPFGAVLIVATERGLVVVAEYLKRMQAVSQQLGAISQAFGCSRFANLKWAANKNEANLRLEWGLKGIGVIPAENKHEIGIQRVQAWLYSNQLFFAYTCPKTIEQFRAYRYAPNVGSDGQKRKEQVFKFEDELPDAVRYAAMAWPELPKDMTVRLSPDEQNRWDSFDDKTRADIEAARAFHKQAKAVDLEVGEEMYPSGGFFGSYENAQF